MNTPTEIKQIIISRFNERVRGKRPDVSSFDCGHDGKAGHWLESQMGVRANASNEPDLMGFEMKCDTNCKTTFGDWSASYYIFRDDPRYPEIDRDRFMEIFGNYNPVKERFSWSGSPVPKIDRYNGHGQILKVDAAGTISAVYSFGQDARPQKQKRVPANLQQAELVLARWDREWMRKKVEDKFNKLGWFKCKLDYSGRYTSIVFGAPINYATWVEGVRKDFIYFDSGMFQGNSRNYSQWRADNRYWDSLIIETY